MHKPWSCLGTLIVTALVLGPLGCKPKAEDTTQPAKGPAASVSSDQGQREEPGQVPLKNQAAPGKQPGQTARGPSLEAADTKAPTSSAPQRKYVVAALGDSITDGRVGGGGYLGVLRERCPESRFVDFGKGGDMTNQMLRRLERDILPRVKSEGFTTLLVYGGVNDLYSDLTAGRTNDRIEESLTTIYQLARGAEMEVVAVTVSPWGGFHRYFNDRRSENTRLLNSWILGQAGDLVDRSVDSYPLLSCGEPTVLCPEYETRFHDGLHPGPKGHQLLGEKLADEAFGDCR